MKSKFGFTIVALLALVAFVCATQTASAQTGQGYPTTAVVLTTSTSTLLPNATTTVTSQAFTVNHLTGFALVPKFALSGTGSSALTFNFAVSVDGTNWTTTTPFSAAVSANGTTSVTGWYNIPPLNTGTGCANAPYVRLATIQNANLTGTATLTSLTILRANR